MFLPLTEVYIIVTTPGYLSTDLCASDHEIDNFKDMYKIDLCVPSASYRNVSNLHLPADIPAWKYSEQGDVSLTLEPDGAS